MKRITAFSSVFILVFLIAGGAVMFTTDKAAAIQPLPCHPDDIVCPSDPCTCNGRIGGTFYCIDDPETIYCSTCWRYKIPCSQW